MTTPWSKSLYYLQPDGSWKRGGDGRSPGKTRAEVSALQVKEESPGTSVGNASVAMPPSMKSVVIMDRRYDPKKPPVLRKKFRQHFEEK
jgi:hypothetical protein